MQERQNWESRNGILAIGIAFLLLIAGIGSFFVMYKSIHNQTISASSKLGPMGDVSTHLEQQDLDLKSIYQQNMGLVFMLEVTRADGDRIGSGFLYNDKGDIVTNAHVVEGTSEVTVKAADSTLYKGKVIGISGAVDAAVVRVPELAGKTPMKISRNGKTEVGDEVITIGNPLGFESTVSKGIISGLHREFNIEPYSYKYKDVYQIDAPISPGNSGGPLLDRKTGEVIGVNAAVSQEGQNIGFSIPIAQVLALADNWSSHPMNLQTKMDLVHSNHDLRLTTDQAEDLIKSYYEKINKQDYVSAYALRGSDMQSTLPYEKFRAGYGHTIEIHLQQIHSDQTTEDRVAVTVIQEVRERADSGALHISHYKTILQIGFENDKLKILKGSQEKIN